MEGTDHKDYLFTFHVGMTCGGCSGAVTKLLSTEGYIKKFELSVEDKKVKVVGPEGTDTKVIDRLTKWATASKKELAFLTKEDLPEGATA